LAASAGPRYRGKIVFYSDRGGPFEIYVMRADGTDVRQLTHVSDGKDVGTERERAALFPRWSPDGERIVFQSGLPQMERGQVYVMKADGTKRHRLTSGADNILPAWSPDGKRIAFVSGRDGYARIYVMDASGARQRPVSPKGEQGAFPTWSPDGKRVAFGCSKGGGAAICAVPVAGGRVTVIWRAPSGFGLLGMDWSPNGRNIVFMGGPDQTPDIYTVATNGKGLRRLTTESANDCYPSWSPDGKRIVFSSKRSGGTDLYVMNADGSAQTRLDDELGHDEAPDWAARNP
jgi:TolB protein